MDCEEEAFTVKGLTKDKSYYFRVAAENTIGQGPFAELPDPVTAKSAFGKSEVYILLFPIE